MAVGLHQVPTAAMDPGPVVVLAAVADTVTATGRVSQMGTDTVQVEASQPATAQEQATVLGTATYLDPEMDTVTASVLDSNPVAVNDHTTHRPVRTGGLTQLTKCRQGEA